MISVTELRAEAIFSEKGDYFLVLSYEHIKIARGSGTIKVKVRNLSTGSIVEKSFVTGAKVQDTHLERKKVRYLYTDNQVHIMDMHSYEQFVLDKRLISDIAKFLNEEMEIELFSVEGKPMYLQIPNIVSYKVTQTGGTTRGNTVGASQKEAIMNNGLVVKVPLFIKTGEEIRVDTRSGQYVERAK
jgi:elongation factor P